MRKPKSEEHKRKLSLIKMGTIAHNRKKVAQLDMEGNLIKVWESVTHAAKALGGSTSNIGNACKGKFKHSKNYKWKYV